MATTKIHPVPILVPPASDASPAPQKIPHAASFWQRRRFWLIGSVLAVVAAAFGYHWAFTKPKVVYTTAAVQRGDIESTVVAAGIVQPVKYVDVGAQTSGMLKSLKVQRGDHVEKGQLLAEIDPALADTALTSSNAALSSMTSQRAVKQAALVLARAQVVRSDALFAAQVLSASERDVARASYAAALADVASLSAQMRQANAAVNTGKTNLSYTKITAPMAGEVVSITLLEGQTLNANQSAPNILRIADISTVTVWSQVSEADIVDVKPGQAAYFTVLGSARRWSGKVRQVLPTPELINNVVFYDVLFDIPNPDGELKIQMTAQVFIVLAQAKGVLFVPAAAIGNASEGSVIKVRVLKPDGSVETRTIKIGIKSELSAEVKTGLNENEKVVIDGKTATAKKTSALTAQKGH
jgi:macrolide-specific efflux system membrane fusion protein